jgi:hypothetical protein
MRRRAARCTSRRRSSPHCQTDKERAGSARFSVLLFAPNNAPSSLRGAIATKQSILSSRLYGLLRGACHRARVRATRWLAMTEKVCRSRELSHHQHVEDDHRRQAQDHRPNAERPKNVLGCKTLLFRDWILFREWIVLCIHDAPAFPVLAVIDTRRILKSRPQFRSHLITGATVD